MKVPIIWSVFAFSTTNTTVWALMPCLLSGAPSLGPHVSSSKALWEAEGLWLFLPNQVRAMLQAFPGREQVWIFPNPVLPSSLPAVSLSHSCTHSQCTLAEQWTEETRMWGVFCFFKYFRLLFFFLTLGFFILFIYLFIYGCVGSSFLCEGFL